MTAALFDLSGKVVVVTGAAGLLGRQHALAVAEMGGVPVHVDIDEAGLDGLAAEIGGLGVECVQQRADVTKHEDVGLVADLVMQRYGGVWGLINNVAANPPMTSGGEAGRLDGTAVDSWNHDLALGLTSAWICSRVFGELMARIGSGSIVNVASDLALIAPDQRVYQADAGKHPAPRKPASYSATKGALRMLSRYFATYWAPVPVRSNCLMPGSVLSTQGPGLVRALEERIPLGRLASESEYRGAIVFLLSDASAYMTGSELVLDGGRSAW